MDHLHDELELAHQKSSLESNKLSRTFSEVPSLTYPDVEPGETVEVTTLPDPNTSWIQDALALAADLSAGEAEDDECGLYPCKWKTGPTVIDQCQQAFDCREVNLNFHVKMCSTPVGFGSAHARLPLLQSARGDAFVMIENVSDLLFAGHRGDL